MSPLARPEGGQTHPQGLPQLLTNCLLRKERTAGGGTDASPRLPTAINILLRKERTARGGTDASPRFPFLFKEGKDDHCHCIINFTVHTNMFLKFIY